MSTPTLNPLFILVPFVWVWGLLWLTAELTQAMWDLAQTVTDLGETVREWWSSL